MKTIKINLYQFKELSKEAKEKTIEQNRDINTYDDWFRYIIEEFKTDMKKKGFEVEETFFSGFWSQDDGACFTGSVDVSKWITINKLGNDYKKLLNHAKEFEGKIIIEHVGRYYHENSMSLRDYAIDWLENNDQDLVSQGDRVYELIKEQAIEEARKLYEVLEKEYMYLSSDESVSETLIANEYDFLKEGGTIQ